MQVSGDMRLGCLLRPVPQGTQAHLLKECFQISRNMNLVRRIAGWPGHVYRPEQRQLSAQGQQESLPNDFPEPLTTHEHKEGWLDHLLQGVEVLLLMTVAAAQIPSLRQVWQEFQESIELEERNHTSERVRGRGDICATLTIMSSPSA